MEENLINAFFVADVVRHGTLFVWQFLDNQIEHIEHASYHLYLVDMLMAHDVADEMEDIENALVFVGGKAEDHDDGGSEGDIEIDESEVY